MNKVAMRLSSIQKDILFLLFAIEQKGNVQPVPGMTVLKMINGSRSSEIFDTNFRVSCHKLNEHQLIEKYRSPQSLKLAWGLSETGRTKAIEIYNSRLVN
jgi:hypothetical protein